MSSLGPLRDFAWSSFLLYTLAPMRNQSTDRFSNSVSVSRDTLHLITLSAFAVAQPIFGILSHNPEFFISRRSGPMDIVLLAAVLLVGLPLPLVIVRILGSVWSRRAGDIVHRVLVAFLVLAILFPPLHRLAPLSGWVALPLAVILATTTSFFLLRTVFAQQALNILFFSLFVFAANFLLRPPISSLVFPQKAQMADVKFDGMDSSIVMVIFDEFPLVSLLDENLKIDPVRFPNFARFASHATWYRNATTVSDDTVQAVPALLTGRYPDPRLKATVTDYPDNLFTLLATSYRFRVFEEYTQLCPSQLADQDEPNRAPQRDSSILSDVSVVYLHFFLPSHWAAFLPSIQYDWKNFGNSDRWRDAPALFDTFVENLDSIDRPTLYFLHVGLPHAPYRRYPSGKAYSKTGREPAAQGWQRGRWTDDHWAVLQSYKRHLLQVGYVDTLLGTLVGRLEELDLFDRSLIVIVSDHGSSFRPRDFRRALSDSNFADIMYVPLFIKAPHQTDGRTDDSNIELIDVLPTMADHLDVALPWEVDGVSAHDKSPRRFSKICFSGEKKSEFGVEAVEARNESVKQKLARFGSGGTEDRIFTIGPNGKSLVGKRLSDVEISESSNLKIRVIQMERFENVDLASDLLPGEVTGFVSNGLLTDAPSKIAVAVNGVIAGTTQTYKVDSPAELASWSVLVEDSAFVPGDNVVIPFVIEETATGVRLLRPGALQGSVHLDKNLGIEPVPGVYSGGFFPWEEWQSHGRIRWTMKTASLGVPVQEDDLPGALRLDLAWTGPTERSLRVTVNKKTLLDEVFRGTEWPAKPWSKTFSLAGVPIKNRVRIELVTRAVGQGKDERRGVAVRGIWLLRSSDNDRPVVRSSSGVMADGFESGDLGAWSEP